LNNYIIIDSKKIVKQFLQIIFLTSRPGAMGQATKGSRPKGVAAYAAME
jgi:hypothetical protein